jgi:glycosyltransferase involved in cell wall biosynthesis
VAALQAVRQACANVAAMPRLSIVIPVLGRHEVLGLVLEALERQDVPPGTFEVVLVSDAEDDPQDIDARARGASLDVRAIVRPSPGVSAARNAGWRESRGELVLFLGADIAPVPRFVAEHLRTHERHAAPEVAVLGSVRWARSLRVNPFMRWLEYGIQFGYAGIEGETAGWGHFHTANASLKRELLERVGGFDESFPFLYEDMDLSYRLHHAGFTLLYNAAAEGEHHHPTTLEEYRPRIAEIAKAERKFVTKYPELEPYFHNRFVTAGGLSPRQGRARKLSFIPLRTPLVGKWVWRRIDAHYKQELAPTFLAGWEAGETG